MSPWKVILATMVIFGCGVVTGGLLMKAGLPHVVAPEVVQQSPAKPGGNSPPLIQIQQPSFLKRMDRQLDLTGEQHDKIVKIMIDSQERTRPLWKMIAPSLRDEMKRVRGEISAVLNPQQKREFDELLKPRRIAGGPNRALRNAPDSTNQVQTNQP